MFTVTSFSNFCYYVTVSVQFYSFVHGCYFPVTGYCDIVHSTVVFVVTGICYRNWLLWYRLVLHFLFKVAEIVTVTGYCVQFFGCTVVFTVSDFLVTSYLYAVQFYILFMVTENYSSY